MEPVANAAAIDQALSIPRPLLTVLRDSIVSFEHYSLVEVHRMKREEQIKALQELSWSVMRQLSERKMLAREKRS